MSKIILKKAPESLSDYKNIAVLFGTKRRLFSEFWDR